MAQLKYRTLSVHGGKSMICHVLCSGYLVIACVLFFCFYAARQKFYITAACEQMRLYLFVLSLLSSVDYRKIPDTMQPEITLNVLTLNCWGIPIVSKDKNPRMKAIASELATGKYDLVCLQEVWALTDFELIREQCQEALPYAHYFHSGVAGSGVCIFSKYPIKDVLFHQWMINGYVHKIQHGDWFGGKGVGLCQIQCEDLLINLYTAHLHAEYSRDSDEYAAHRVLQAFDTAQLVKMTSGSADVVILGGDLNTEPGDLSYQVLLHSAELDDAFSSTPPNFNCSGTYESPRNSYRSGSTSSEDQGQRIDYILFKGGPHAKVAVESYYLPLQERVPGLPYSYSDHEGVAATFKISPIPAGSNSQGSTTNNIKHARQLDVLEKALCVCEAALSRMAEHRHHYYLFSCLLIIGLFAAVCIPFNSAACKIIIPILTAILCFMLFMATLWNNMEVNAILAGKTTMLVAQSRLKALMV